MNVPGTLHALRVLTHPALLLPHATVPTFADLPSPLAGAFLATSLTTAPDIRAVVLDKDNCFAAPHAAAVHPSCAAAFAALRAAYPGARLLIVSNTAGLAARDPDGTLAAAVERATGVAVLRHAKPKPACAAEVLAHLRARVGAEDGAGAGGDTAAPLRPAQVAVVGDRLLTDAALAHAMGAWAVWVRDGVDGRGRRGWGAVEGWLEGRVRRWGWEPPRPGKEDEGG